VPLTAARPSETGTARRTAGSWTTDDLRRVVAAHHAHDERERVSKTRFLAELDRLERPFDRYADPVHVTASAVVAGNRGTVLHRHRRLGRWLQPGGHLDAGESPPNAAMREVEEEVGLTAVHPDVIPRLLHLDVHSAADDHVHLDLRYLLFASDDDPRPAQGESPDARWVTWAEAEVIADDALRGALIAAQRVLRGTGASAG
jgi:8-oxo-dGTP pyrophosphatase MutT (NUDIX family)